MRPLHDVIGSLQRCDDAGGWFDALPVLGFWRATPKDQHRRHAKAVGFTGVAGEEHLPGGVLGQQQRRLVDHTLRGGQSDEMSLMGQETSGYLIVLADK